ncbi:MAG TPA: hypothetical protein VGQ85_01370 [Candidatus Limnocylindrales bacterium]|nr:hypothetical protein [Candidatus Limnocylindrales bacterium]
MWKVGILAALTLAVGAFLQGCFPFPPFVTDPTGCDAFPPAIPSTSAVVYRTASGSIELSGTLPAKITLTKFGTSGPPPAFDPSCLGGAAAEFTDAAGQWAISVFAYPPPTALGGLGGPSMIAITRRDVDPALIADLSQCTTFSEISAAGLVGHAECHGLRWTDPNDFGPNPNATQLLPSFAPFDLTVTFEARP